MTTKYQTYSQLRNYSNLSNDRDIKYHWKILYLFNVYRLTLNAVFITFSFIDIISNVFGKEDESLFLTTTWVYLLFTLASFISIHQRWPIFKVQVLTQVLVDIAVLTLLMHASGGLNSGVGILLIITVAGGSLLTEGKIAFFFAAVASLAILIQVWIASLYFEVSYYTYYTQYSGLLGITFFATALVTYALARRIRANENIVRKQKIELENLNRLNAEIVQHIQAGIIVVDIAYQIRLHTEFARKLLGISQDNKMLLLTAVAPELVEQIIHWRKTKKSPSPLFQPKTGEVELLAHFSCLQQKDTQDLLMIMLEDATWTAKQVQQLKLASLGRLTAKISHEIRNPLNIISQANQLLEDSSLPEKQLKFTGLITKHTQRINHLIESVLQLSRQGDTKIQTVNLNEWLSNFVDELILSQRLQPDDILLEMVSSVVVCFDKIQLYQVVSNICENGLRYSQTSPLLKLMLSRSEDSGKPYLDICDHGQGMSQDTVENLFEPFFTTEFTGNGLGLYVAKEICEANQATLQLYSNTDTGCCFRIYFTNTGENNYEA